MEFSANASLSRVQHELDKKTDAIAVRTNDTLSKLYQNFEKAAQDNVGVAPRVASGSQMTRILQERAAEVSREFSTGLEGYTRSYLESIGKSIAEIPQNMPGRSGLWPAVRSPNLWFSQSSVPAGGAVPAALPRDFLRVL